jgi:anti-sigma factor RsiW
MSNFKDNIINCSRFEELLTDYLDKALDPALNSAVAEHALACPLCHTLLNDVKESIEACRAVAAPAPAMTRLEAKILSATMPQTAMACADFEAHLTDYLDGFLPAHVFHRWERHAVMCDTCSDLPGMVVRSIAACYTYKLDELAVPAGLHDRILNATIGTTEVREVRASRWSEVAEWVRGFRLPIPVPQLASVTMMLLVAFFVFTQAVSADGTLTGVYAKGIELAEQTYQQSASALNGGTDSQSSVKQEPVTGTTYVNREDTNK